ncbi:MAG: bifunctional riboflavin kinase/FAD synthetase [Isosphaeraceae bacterium]|nr:bifunctional riboflavin kinase/FAD synthetase [Isosphaeraceae bacterium]
MIWIESFDVAPASVRGAYLAIGNFDGVHRGHAHLIGRLRARAEAAGAPALALTFDPHPLSLLRPDSSPAPLLWTERKVELLKESGADEVGVFRTGPWLLRLTAREFFDRVIVDQLEARGMVEGPNFGFGRDRGGDSELLASWCADAGIAFEVDSATATEADGRLVSSSRIRTALEEGDLASANSMLGRPHVIRGRVTHGAARGRGLGFPTANLDEIDTLIPADGVYAARARIDGVGTEYLAACNIGPNPTFGEQSRKVEAHLLDFSGEIYGSYVELAFVERLRGTRRFHGLDDLLAQIAEDVERTRITARSGGR